MEYHAQASPSGAAGWLQCPSWQSDPEGSVYADEGTAAHTLFAWCLTEGRDAAAYKGRRIAVGLRTFEVDTDMVVAVQVAVDLVRYYVKTNDGLLYVEQDLPLEHITGEKDATGRGDVVILCSNEIIVVDLKYGYREVSAIGNPQCKLYGLGALKKFEMVASPEWVRVVITQPRVSSTPSEWSVKAAELEAWVPAVAKAATILFATRKGLEAEVFNPSTKACEWCARKADCPGLARMVQDVVGAEFDVLASPAAKTQLEPATAALKGGDLSLKMKAADVIEMWIKSVRAQVERLLLAGDGVPGYKLVQGRQGDRKWSNPSEAEEYMKKSMRLKVEEMYDLKLISPTTAEKLVKAKVIGPKQWEKLKDGIIRAEGSISVAPAEDKRPAYQAKPTTDDFEVSQ